MTAVGANSGNRPTCAANPDKPAISGFAAHVGRFPEFAPTAVTQACRALGVTSAEAECYFLGRLHALGGWAQLGRYRQWQAELGKADDATIIELLAVALTFEAGVLSAFGGLIANAWADGLAAFAKPVLPSRDLVIDCLLQDAFDRASQRELIARLGSPNAVESAASVQAIFCIDVRSERFRRALETIDPSIETLGFAGFFGLGVSHRRFGSSVEEARLPVLLSPGLSSFSCDEIPSEAEDKHRIVARVRRAWGRFKLAAVSSFAFVEASGPLYVGKLMNDSLGLRRQESDNEPAPQLMPALTLEQKAATAAAVLGAMSLTAGFAPIVLLVGHGATVVNNAHAGALQ